jgi:hypothetical protein
MNSLHKPIRVWYRDRVETLTLDEFRVCNPEDVLAVKEWTRGIAAGPLLHHTKNFISLPPGEMNVKSFNREDMRSYLTRHAPWIKWGLWLDDVQWREILARVEADTWTPSA